MKQLAPWRVRMSAMELSCLSLLPSFAAATRALRISERAECAMQPTTDIVSVAQASDAGVQCDSPSSPYVDRPTKAIQTRASKPFIDAEREPEDDGRGRTAAAISPTREEMTDRLAAIAGHKVPENDDDPRIIAETRQYLRDFNRLNTATTTARELYDAMLAIYPDRANPGSLWGAANIAKK